MSRLGRSSPVPAVIVRAPAAPVGGTTYDATGGAASALVGSGAVVAEHLAAGTGLSALVGSGPASAIRSASGVGISALVGSGVASTTQSASGTGISGLVGSGSAARTLDTMGTGVVGSAGSGDASATLSTAGTGISTLVGSGAVEVVPYVPPAPPAPVDTGGGGDAWASTGGRPYIRRRPVPPRTPAPARSPDGCQSSLALPQPVPQVQQPASSSVPIGPLPFDLDWQALLAPQRAGDAVAGDTFPRKWVEEEEELLLLGIL